MRKSAIAGLAGTFALLLPPAAAWATQEHSDPEGLYSHQIAHIFFIFSMFVLIFQIRRSRPIHRGWRFIGMAAAVFLLWNVDVFIVHAIRENIDSSLFAGSAADWSQTLDVSSLMAKVFYAGKILDHFFLSGAMVLFVLGLRRLVGESGDLWEEF